MKRSTLFSCKAGLLALLIFIAVYGSFSSVPASQWFNQTFNGIATSLTFELNFPLWLAFSSVVFLFLVVFSLGFYFSKPLFIHLDL